MGKLVAIHLHGPLADRYGSLHHFSVQTPREALYALDANYPGFLADFAAHERYGIMVDDDWREGENAAILPASKDVHFVPVVEGEVPFVAFGLTAVFGLSATAATIVGSLLVTGLMIGISLLFRPKKPQQKEAEEIDDSYIFSGPENVSTQGVAVPLIYGRVYAGSVVVSAGQDTVDVITTTPQAGNSKPSSGNSGRPDGYSPPEYRGGRDGRSNARMAMVAPYSEETLASRAAPVSRLSVPVVTQTSFDEPMAALMSFDEPVIEQTSFDEPVAAQTSFTSSGAPAVQRQYALTGMYIADEGTRSYGFGVPGIGGYMVELPAAYVGPVEPYEAWPNLIDDGAGVEHLRDEPVDGWPDIVEDPVYAFKPVGWVPVKSVWVSEEDHVHRKQVYVWQPDYETLDYVYNWNMVRGFYVTEIPVGDDKVISSLAAEEPEWIAGADMEVPVIDPSP